MSGWLPPSWSIVTASDEGARFPLSTLQVSVLLVSVGRISTLLGVYVVKVVPKRVYFALAEILLTLISLHLIHSSLVGA